MRNLSILLLVLIIITPLTAAAQETSSPVGLNNLFYSLGLIVHDLRTAVTSTITTGEQPHYLGELQGTYMIDQRYLSIFPFTIIAVLDPNDNNWYTISIEGNKVTILNHLTVEPPQYYLYPTILQLQSFESILAHIKRNGLTILDKLQLIELWYDVKKIEVEIIK